MEIHTEADCQAYVATQLEWFVRSCPGWHAAPSTDVPPEPLTWKLRHEPSGSGWYTLQADLAGGQFLIWYGCHHVGDPGLHWIMRPAVHVAFEALEPRSDPIGLRFCLSDVLESMAGSLNASGSFMTRFDLNTFSFT